MAAWNVSKSGDLQLDQYWISLMQPETGSAAAKIGTAVVSPDLDTGLQILLLCRHHDFSNLTPSPGY